MYTYHHTEGSDLTKFYFVWDVVHVTLHVYMDQDPDATHMEKHKIVEMPLASHLQT